MKSHHVLILGCGRSGTSIFGEFFEQIAGYRYYSEPDFDKLVQFNFDEPTAVKVPRESDVIESDLGLSFPIEVLSKKMGRPKIFWQVRNPLDAICSLKVGISKDWGHHPRPPDWKEWVRRPLAVQCAHHWNWINTVGFGVVKDIATITFFEDMIHDSEGFAHQICQQAEIDVQTNTQAIARWCQRVQNTNNVNFLEAETSKPYSTEDDHRVKVGRWKDNMTDEELELVLPVVESTAKKFGYKLPG